MDRESQQQCICWVMNVNLLLLLFPLAFSADRPLHYWIVASNIQNMFIQTWCLLKPEEKEKLSVSFKIISYN